MKYSFVPHTFYGKAQARIAECNAVCTLYHEKGFTLTLRQLFYQLVSRNVITNTTREYKNLGVLLTDARLAGLIDWEHITDRIRVSKNNYDRHFESPEDLITRHAAHFTIDLWKEQQYRPEVWVEKEALVEVVHKACRPLGVPYLVVKAYNSSSAMWDARKRFRQYLKGHLSKDGSSQIPVILHLGDHDSTGVDCSRWLLEQMTLLLGGGLVKLDRLALNMAQIEKYELPPQDGKDQDPRFKDYVAKFGTDKTWELDALGPDIIERIIDDGIRKYMDADIHDDALKQQGEHRDQMRQVSDRWKEVLEFLEDQPEAE